MGSSSSSAVGLVVTVVVLGRAAYGECLILLLVHAGDGHTNLQSVECHLVTIWRVQEASFQTSLGSTRSNDQKAHIKM